MTNIHGLKKSMKIMSAKIIKVRNKIEPLRAASRRDPRNRKLKRKLARIESKHSGLKRAKWNCSNKIKKLKEERSKKKKRSWNSK